MANRAVVMQAAYNIDIQNGSAPKTSSPAVGQAITFNNLDNTDYLIELWTKGNDKHIDLCLFVPAGGSTTVYGDPNSNNGNGTCHYNVLAYTPGQLKSTSPAPDTGGNVIIIGNGNT